MIHGFLTLVALVASEVAILGLAFVWVFIPGIEGQPGLYATWAVGSVFAALIAMPLAAHLILAPRISGKGASATPFRRPLKRSKSKNE